MRIGPRFNKHCANISVQDGQELNWAQSCRYVLPLKVLLTSSVTLVKQKNRFTDLLMLSLVESVELQRKMSQCLPTLLYATEACPLNKSDIRALD